MPKIKLAFVLVAIVFLSWTVSQTNLLHAESSEPLYIVVVDRHAAGMSQENQDLAVSFVGLLSALRENQRVGFLTADSEEFIGPAVSGSAEHKNAYKELTARIEDSSSVPAHDLSASLSYAHELMKFESAGEGSTVYVVSGGELEGEAPFEAFPIGDTISAFNRDNWHVVSIALPGSSTYAKDFMRTASSGTGGDVFPLSTPQELKLIADSVLSVDARGSLFEIGQNELAPTDVFTAPIEVAPSTTESSIVFFKQGAAGSLSLQNPAGIKASEGDRALSSVIETPHAVVWTLTDPAPGEWVVDVRGANGFISAWHYPNHKLNLNLVSFETIPFDQNNEIVAYVSDGETRVDVPNAELRATIIDTTGQIFTYTLNDNGELGDSIPGDLYYSTTVPPLSAEGKHNIELELYWPEYEHSIFTRNSVMAQGFPVLDVDLTHTEGLTLGKRATIGTVEVKVNEQPYGIPTSMISAEILSESGKGVVEIIPRELLNTGHAWNFDIVFTPAEEELHTLFLRLDMEYAAREYSFMANSQVLSSFALPAAPPTQSVVVPVQQSQPSPPPVVVQPAPPAPVVVEQPPALPQESGSFPVMAVIYTVASALALIVIAALIYVAYRLTRPSPYGYLYDDTGKLLVDFSTIERPFATLLTSKNLLRGEELDVPEMRGLSFYYTKGNVDIRSSQTEPTIRVNNRPLINGQETRSLNQSWIGTQGKLFSLYLMKPDQASEPSVAPIAGDAIAGDD